MITLPDWATLAQQHEAPLPLLEGALLIARDESPDLDADYCDVVLQSHASHLEVEVRAAAHPAMKMHAINRHLFEELGYTGNQADYYDPRNSYLDQVLLRRLGNPISLAIVQIEVARRLGIPLQGISFPGHFLVRLALEDGFLVMDPFLGGRPLDLATLRERVAPHLAGELPDDAELAALLQPASTRSMLVRILRNLHGGYADAGDWARAVRCADRLLHLSPGTAEALRDRGLGYLALGHLGGAREDLGAYLRLHPEAPDADAMREQLVHIGHSRNYAH